MNRLMAVIPFFLLALMACRSKPPKTTATTSKTDTTKFYPVSDFFNDQIRYIDLRNFNLYKITLKDGKKDSSAISKDQFLEWAKTFMNRAIPSALTAASYKESVFHDLSTGSLTLTYAPIDNEAVIQNIAVLLEEDTHFVKRVYIKLIDTKNDTTVIENYNWATNKSIRFNRTLTTKNGFTSSELYYINWNDKP